MKDLDKNNHNLSKMGGGGGYTLSQKSHVKILRKNGIVSQTFQCFIFGLHAVSLAFIVLAKTVLKKPKFLINKILTNHYPRLQKPSSGYILILVGCFVPVLLGMMKYTELQFQKRWRSVESLSDPNDATYYKECAREIALAVAKEWNPAKTLKEQEAKVYEIAKNIYNAHPCLQKGGVRSAIPGLVATTVDGDKIDLPPDKKQFSKSYVEISLVNDEKYGGKIKVRTDYQIAYAIPAECNIDVVFAVPVNSDAIGHLPSISQACKDFVLNNFSNIRGVYMSIVPYSGKLSIPSGKSYENWTVALPQFSASGDTVTLSSLYATIRGNGQNLAQGYSWTGTVLPIMHRKNKDLFSPNDPTSSEANKYLRMNLNPCYASPQSSKCEHNCTEYYANQSCIVEPMRNMPDFCDKLGSLSINGSDSRNKSNFIFMALEWANNMFQSWTAGSKAETASSERLSYPVKGANKAVILLVNKAESFEPAELTYLGFKNDASQVLRDSDVILDFGNTNRIYADGTSGTTIQGVKKLLSFSTDTSGKNCTFSMPAPHILKFIVDKNSQSNGSIKFTNIKYKDDTYYQNEKEYAVSGRTSFIILAEQIAGDNTVKFTASGVKFISAEMTDKALTDSEAIPVYCRLDGTKSGTGTATITCNAKREMTLTVAPKQTYAKIGNKEEKGFSGEKTFEFSNQTTDLAYELVNAEISSAKIKVNKPETELITEETKIPGHSDKEIDTGVSSGTVTLQICIYWGDERGYSYDTSHCAPPATKVLIDGITIASYSASSLFDLSFNNEDSSNTKVNNGPKEVVIATSSKRMTAKTTTISHNFQKTNNVKIKIVTGKCYNEGVNMGSYTRSYPIEIKSCKVKGSYSEDAKRENNQIKVGTGGDLTVKVKPTVPSASLSHIKAGVATPEESVTGSKLITITPSEYDYVKSGNEYKITLNLKDIGSVSEPEMTDKLRLFDAKISTPPAISTDNNTIMGAATLQSKTETAGEKLKNAGARIYVIGTPTAYISNCATNTGGKAYTIKNFQAELKEKLAVIAAELKKFGGYKHARIVR